MPTVIQNSITGSDSTFLESGGQIAIDVRPIGGAGPFANDKSTLAQTIIDNGHHEIHDGSAYNTYYNKDVPNGGSMVMVMITPNTSKFNHLLYESTSEAEMSSELWEGATVTNSGTAIGEFNHNRTSSNTSSTKCFHTPTLVTSGTLLVRTHHGAGKSAGGKTRGSSEWILNSGTMYLLALINETSSANQLSGHFEWYEHTDKNPIA